VEDWIVVGIEVGLQGQARRACEAAESFPTELPVAGHPEE
jgi:hypothetical protein